MAPAFEYMHGHEREILSSSKARAWMSSTISIIQSHIRVREEITDQPPLATLSTI